METTSIILISIYIYATNFKIILHIKNTMPQMDTAAFLPQVFLACGNFH